MNCTRDLRLSRCIVHATLLLLATGVVSGQPKYTITDLGSIGRTVTTDPFDRIPINASGQVALWRANADFSVVRPILWHNGVVTDLGTLPGDTAGKAWALNDAGQVAGASGTMTPPSGTGTVSFSARRGFFATSGRIDEIYPLGPFPRGGHGLNASGHIVGETTSLRPFLYTPTTGVLLDLGTFGGTTGRARAINASGQIVGSANTATNERHAFLYENGALRDLGTLGGTTSNAEAINAAGQIVGWSTRADGATRAFVYEGGRMSELPAIAGANDTRAVAINASRQIVGYYVVGTAAPRTFLVAGDTMQDLSTLVPLRSSAAGPSGPAGFLSLLFAGGINDAGFITGIGSYVSPGATTSTSNAFLLTPAAVPRPAAVTVAAGATVVIDLATVVTATAFQWQRNGTAIAGATGPSLILTNAAEADAGVYSCRLTTAGGPYLSFDSTVSVLAPGGAAPPGRLINLSVLTSLAGGADSFTVGTVVGGAGTTGTKPLLVRAGGPSLAAFGLAGWLADPRLEVFASATKIGENDNWGGGAGVGAASAQVGAFAFASASSRDAAVLLPEVSTGDISVVISGVGGGAGAVIAELYDATPAAAFTTTTPRLVNVSVLKPIGAGLTVGFVIGGGAAQTVLVRAIGPSLAGFGVAGALADPWLELYAGPAKIAENDNWSGAGRAPTLALAFARLGAFLLPNDSKDAAVLVTLPPGSYTVRVEGVAGTTGTALVEVYEVP